MVGRQEDQRKDDLANLSHIFSPLPSGNSQSFQLGPELRLLTPWGGGKGGGSPLQGSPGFSCLLNQLLGPKPPFLPTV